MHKNKGFTLVELCVVIAICAIIATMIVTFVFWMKNQNAKVKNTDGVVLEMTSFQTSVESLLSKYDNSDYSISVEEQKISICHIKTNNIVEIINYVDSAKSLKNRAGATICLMESCQALKFEPIIDGENVIMIKCEIIFYDKNENKNESQMFYFSIHNNIVRERFVSPNRPRSEE